MTRLLSLAFLLILFLTSCQKTKPYTPPVVDSLARFCGTYQGLWTWMYKNNDTPNLAVPYVDSHTFMGLVLVDRGINDTLIVTLPADSLNLYSGSPYQVKYLQSGTTQSMHSTYGGGAGIDTKFVADSIIIQSGSTTNLGRGRFHATSVIFIGKKQ